MAGINRLGKAPPKPGTLRPPDPNKYRTVDMFSEGAEGDADYLKMVQDIEDSQQQQGWLFGRGAFDKGDLLYLRDEAEKQRHAELELRDKELNQFAALKARMEREQNSKNSSEMQIPKKAKPLRSGTQLLGRMLKVRPKKQLELKKRKQVDDSVDILSESVQNKSKKTDKHEEKASEHNPPEVTKPGE